MSHTTHDQHTHVHGAQCGHVAILHNGHVDYLHDDHLHASHEGHYDEHVLEVNAQNPAAWSKYSQKSWTTSLRGTYERAENDKIFLGRLGASGTFPGWALNLSTRW